MSFVTSVTDNFYIYGEGRTMRILMVAPKTNYPDPGISLDIIAQGPAYIVGAMKSAGHEVYGVNTSYDSSNDPAQTVLQRHMAKAITEFQPDVIAVGGMAAEYLFLTHTIQIARNLAPHTPIVCGGGIMTNDRQHAFELLRPDFAVVDEGEYVIVNLLERLENGDSMADCGGVDYWENGKPRHNNIRTPISDLDALPYPDYNFMDIDTFFNISSQKADHFYVHSHKRPRALPVLTGRSCPFKCTFCQYSTLEGSRRKYRGRQMKHVIDEITHFHDLYQFNILRIYDDLFSVKEDRIREFCERLKETKLDLVWNASMRVGDVNVDLLKEMKDAGCSHIGYGFESASDKVLTSMAKKVTKEQLLTAIQASEEAGIGIQANFIYGDPAETVETIVETEEFYKQHCLDHIVHHDFIMPYPGSPIFDHSVAIGAITDRKKYYESIHLRPRYNMTKMTTPDFFHEIHKIVDKYWTGLKFAKNVDYFEAGRAGFEDTFFDDKILLGVYADCPHCEEKNDYVFPMEHQALSAGRDELVKPIRFYCRHCHKRLMISLLPLIHIEESVKAFMEKVQGLADQNTVVSVTPLVGRLQLDAYCAYGFPKDALNISSYLAYNPVPSGAEFDGTRVEFLQGVELARFNMVHHIVLPVNNADTIIAHMMENGVEPDRITALDEDVAAAIQKLETATVAAE
jgi:anaerobic magnesium-protoporphyrin IX monomethyl ester cyclase